MVVVPGPSEVVSLQSQKSLGYEDSRRYIYDNDVSVRQHKWSSAKYFGARWGEIGFERASESSVKHRVRLQALCSPEEFEHAVSDLRNFRLGRRKRSRVCAH